MKIECRPPQLPNVTHFHHHTHNIHSYTYTCIHMPLHPLSTTRTSSYFTVHWLISCVCKTLSPAEYIAKDAERRRHASANKLKNDLLSAKTKVSVRPRGVAYVCGVVLLDAVGCCWMLLDAVGCCWMLSDVVGCSWMLLDVAGCCFGVRLFQQRMVSSFVRPYQGEARSKF